MYSIEWASVLSLAPKRRPVPCGNAEERPAEAYRQTAARSVSTVGRTVWALGFTSLFTDISSEMISSVLPVYLVLHLGMSPLIFGVVDGIYQGAAVLVRVIAGVLSDRWQRHKEIAACGYGLSAICRLLILAAGNASGAIAAVVALDRVGKGIRTPPRDALISRSSRVSELSTAFSVHRALDATGAMLGPIFAFALLAIIPAKFDILFVASFGIAVVGLGVILIFVPSHSSHERKVRHSSISMASAFGLLVEPRFRGLVLASAILGLSTISDGFIFLVLQKRINVSVTAFPLLYVGTSLATAVSTVPLGRLADRFGRVRILISGYISLAGVYLILLFPFAWEWAPLMFAILLFGIYYAATDGVLTAIAAAALPVEQSGSGLAVLATASNLARVIGSMIFGLLWYRLGTGTATTIFLVALGVSIAVAVRLLRLSKNNVLKPSIV
ncbi:MFS transporter [Verrucomicrobiota bacterium sgz303538]